MDWKKPIKGQEAIAKLPSSLARQYVASGLKTADLVAKAERLRAAGGGLDVPPRLPDDRVLAPAVQAAAVEDLGVERISILELRVDRLEEALAAWNEERRIGSPVAGPLYREAGKQGKTTEKLVSPQADDAELGAFGEADRRARWRAANREKIREADRARKAKKKAEAGQ